MPNETELAILSGLPVATEAEIEAAARSLIAKGIGTVIVTMGARGALLRDGARRPRASRRCSVTPVDTTGAGDAFIGSFARYYVDGGERSTRPWTRPCATPPIRSPGAARRRPMRPRPNSKLFARSSREMTASAPMEQTSKTQIAEYENAQP